MSHRTSPLRKSLAVAAIALLLALSGGEAEARSLVIDGTVVHVTDGDTLWLKPDAAGERPFKLRLAGIDAPERCQSGGAQAGAALAARVLHRRVQAVTRATDDFQRAVATVRLDGEDIAAWLVLQGHAWTHGYRHAPGPYARQEAEARAARRGIFADPLAQDPRLFRRLHGPCE
jgi:endonuclease YncB( thermonuclease family)